MSAKTAAVKLVLLALLALTARTQAADAPSHVTIAGLDVAVWKPAGSTPLTGFPVVVFSHGFMGCNTQSIFLMEALAQAGYLVVAPNHKDARCGTAQKDSSWYPGKMLGRSRPQQRFGDPKDWSDSTYRDRHDDIEAVLNVVLHDPTFQGVAVDHDRVAIAGHSLGGYTALGMAGAWPSWKDKRIQAVLALSPYCAPYSSKGALGHMGVPVMYQGGTRDLGISPTVKRPQGCYDLSSSPKYFVDFDGASHFAWTNLVKEHQAPISQYSVAFFDRYLQHADPDPLTPLIGNKHPAGVSEVRAAGK